VSLTSSLYRLGRGAARRPRPVIAVWVLAAAAVFAAGRTAGAAFVDDFRIPGAEAQAATDLLRERFPAQAGVSATVVFHARSGTLAEPAAMQAIRATLARVAALPHVVRVDDPTQAGGQAGVSADRTIAFSTVHYEGSLSELGRAAADRLVRTVSSARSPALQVEAGGPLVEYTHLPEPRGAEAVGLTAAVIVLFLAFGSVVAMGLPIATALVGLGTSLSIVWLLSHVTDVPTLTPTLATMLALGVGIDYALFIVTRYREGLQRGEPIEEAVGRAIATSGQAVLFAGFTVMVAIWGLWVSGIPFIGMIGTVASISIAVAVLAALTLLPALLGTIGARIDALGLLRLRHRVDLEDRGVWARWARTVARHPWPALVAGLALVGVMTVPMFSMRFGLETGVAGKGSTQARAAALVERGFGPGVTSPLLLLVELRRPGDTAALQEIAGAVSADPDVATLTEPVVAPGDDGPRAAPPRAHPSAARATDRRAGARRRGDPDPARPHRPGGRAAAAAHRGRRGALLRPAPARVPLDPRAGEGRGAERALDLRGLRRRRRRLPVGVGRGAHRRGPHGADRLVRADGDVRDPVRPLDGLRGVPALARP
jgi:RND superfamily putative drug exporter